MASTACAHGRRRYGLGGFGAASAGRRGIPGAASGNYIAALLAQAASRHSRRRDPTPRRPPAPPACCSSLRTRVAAQSSLTPPHRRRHRSGRRSAPFPARCRAHRSRHRSAGGAAAASGPGVSTSRLGIAGNRPMRQYSKASPTFDTPATTSLGDFRRSLIHLKDRDSETLQYLMQGTLDSRRIASMRGSRRSPRSGSPP